MDIFFPVQLLAQFISIEILKLEETSLLGGAVIFFIYDSVKIFILLFTISFLSNFIRSYLPPEKIRKILVNRFGFLGNILAALFGIITPFCSCSAIPLFIGFLESGVPLGVTFSYLVSAPMINEVAAIMLLGLFGPTLALIYIASGLIIAILAGSILGKLKLEYLVEDYVWKIKAKKTDYTLKPTIKDRVINSIGYTRSLVKNIYLYILLGVGIGAFIHGYAPENLLAQFAGKNNPLAVPLAVAIGVPLYSNAAGTIPIVSSLIEKGLPIGTSLAFMMSITALSLPEMIILRKVLKLKLLLIFISIVSLGIILTGYLFNIIL